LNVPNASNELPVTPPFVQFVVPKLSSVRVSVRRDDPFMLRVAPTGMVVVALPFIAPPDQFIVWLTWRLKSPLIVALVSDSV
jgi:hypothetical protein